MTIYWPIHVVTVCISYQIFPGIVDLTPPYNRCLNRIFRCIILCVCKQHIEKHQENLKICVQLQPGLEDRPLVDHRQCMQSPLNRQPLGVPPSCYKPPQRVQLIGTWITFQDVDHRKRESVAITPLNIRTENTKLAVNIYEKYVRILLILSVCPFKATCLA